MRLGFVVYGSLSERSGGFRYDRKLVEGLRARGHDVSVVGLPWDRYAKSLCHNLVADFESRFSGFDAVLEDHLCHPSLLRANRALDVPVVAVVHHLRSSEPRAAMEERVLSSRRAAVFQGSRCRGLQQPDHPTVSETPSRLSDDRGVPRGRPVRSRGVELLEIVGDRFSRSATTPTARSDSSFSGTSSSEKGFTSCSPRSQPSPVTGS